MKIKIVLILFFYSTFYLNSQILKKWTIKHHFKKAVHYIQFKNYNEALIHLNYLLKEDSLNANYNYYCGLCYSNTNFNQNKAINYFKIALKSVNPNWKEFDYKEKNAPLLTYFFIGKMYHLLYQFDTALFYFNKFKESFTSDHSYYKENERMIEICGYAKELINDTIEISIENLGPGINSQYDDHSPTLTANENILIFTSRRPSNHSDLKTDDGRYFEDIYIAHKINNNWEVKPIGNNINTAYHEASICVSPDGQELYIYKDDFGNGNLYVSYKDSMNNWTKPEKLSPYINSSSNETHATISADKNLLIFSSDRPGGKGGKDLYFSVRLPNGDWSLPQNLGDNINTEYDEEGPFLLPDGYTLYFSSKGHNTIGGYDLFYSELNEDGSWSKPVNLGYPINSTTDDVFFHLSADEKRAYFSSMREDSYGGKDIYVMNLLSLPERSSAVVKGFVFYENNDTVPVTDINIKVYDNQTSRLMGIYRPNKQTGYYVMILRQNHEYNIICENESYEFEPKILKIPQHSSLFEINQPIILEPLGKLKRK